MNAKLITSLLAAFAPLCALAPAAPPPKGEQETLIRSLDHEDPRQRVRTLRKLYGQHDPANPPNEVILPLLDDESLEVRMAVYGGAGRMKGLARPIAERLLEIAGKPERSAEAKAGFAQLQKARQKAVAAADPLLEALPFSRGEPLEWIAMAAFRVGAPISPDLALAVYRSEPNRMKLWFGFWAEYSRSPRAEVIEILAKELAGPVIDDGWHLSRLSNGLGYIGPPAAPAVAALTAALDHELPHVRRYTARALSWIGPAATPALGKIREMARNDPDERVRNWCAEAAGILVGYEGRGR